jgi:hypothetical protein
VFRVEIAVSKCPTTGILSGQAIIEAGFERG